MLDSIYGTIFKPAQVRTTTSAAIAIGLLSVLILAFNAAGSANLGAGGIISFTGLFLFAGVLGWYWFSASVHLLVQLLGGQGNITATLRATAQGLWPLLFTAPAIAAARWSTLFGALFSLAISIGVFVTLTATLSQVHQLSWLKTLLSIAITLALSFLALSGLILWPLMILLGMFSLG